MDRQPKLFNCQWCKQDKPIGEFYARKRGPSAGTPTRFCKLCNTIAAKYQRYKAAARAGTIDTVIGRLEDDIKLANQAKQEIQNVAIREKALELGMALLRERGEI